MTELLCQSTVDKLLKASLNYKEYKRLVGYLNSQTDAPIWDIALVWTPEIREKFLRTMVELQKELVPQYIDIDSLYNKLWELFREVVLNKSIYQNSANLESKLSDFTSEVKKPLAAFEVLYEIRHFSIGKRQIKLGNVEIFELTEDYLKSLESGESLIDEKWMGRSVVKIMVEATEIGNALAAGRAKAESVLHLLRVAIRKELLSEPEYMFLWEMGSSIAVPCEKTGNIAWAIGGNSNISPLTIDLGDKIEKCFSDSNIWNYAIENKMPEDINRRVLRAIEWISHGIAGENLDYKFVNLCVALEILLLPEERRVSAKGAHIALRQALVGKNNFANPSGIYAQYQRRNDIIHGGYLNITSSSDYWHMLTCCLSVLENIIRLSQKYPTDETLRLLLNRVENEETLKDFIVLCEQGMLEGRYMNKIKKAAQDLL